MAQSSAHSSKMVHKIRDDLASELLAIQELAQNVSLSATNNLPNCGAERQDSEEKMEVSYEPDDFYKFEKELYQTCERLACIIDGIGPVFPKSKAHSILSYLRRITEEVNNMKLVNERIMRHEKALDHKEELFELQKNSLERALVGAQKRLADREEERKMAAEVLTKVQEEFSHTRSDLHFVITKLFPEDSEEMKNLLAALTASRSSDSVQENWADISSCETSHVELLLRYCIIEMNPVNDKLARFTL